MNIENLRDLFNMYPWDRGIKPYFISEEGFEWYVDTEATSYAKKDQYLLDGNTRKGLKEVVAFYVKSGSYLLGSVLINCRQEVILEAKGSMDLMFEIDKLKIWEDYATHEDRESLMERKNYIKEITDFISE